MNVAVFSSPEKYSEIVEPYNTLNAIIGMQSRYQTNILFDNQALNRICEEKLGIHNDKLRYSDLNQLIAHYMSSITATMRFGGSINKSLYEIHNNMVPYPRICYLTGSMAPLTPAD